VDEATTVDGDVEHENHPDAVFAGGEGIASLDVDVAWKGRVSEQKPAVRTGKHGEAAE